MNQDDYESALADAIQFTLHEYDIQSKLERWSK